MFKKLARLPQAGCGRRASRRPARADGPKVGLDGPASLAAGRAPWRAVQHQLSAVGGRILLADAADKLKVCAMSAEAIG